MIQKNCAASGQRVNYDKSSKVFSVNTLEKEIERLIQEETNLAVGRNSGVYLGVPSLWGLLKTLTSRRIKDMVLTKLKGRKQQTLS